LKNKDHIGEFHQMDMNKTIDGCIESLGKCERIKSTPFPRQYAFFSKAFTWIFVLMLPLGLLGELNGVGIWNYSVFILLTTLISWIFITMELVADFSEDPFENFASDVPMSAICRNVEIELKTFLGETGIPDKISPRNGYLL
jgi:putative membrane protein